MLTDLLQKVIDELIKLAGEILLFVIFVMLAMLYHFNKDTRRKK